MKTEKEGSGMSKKAKQKERDKTNVMRLLDRQGIPYRHYALASTDTVSGNEVAAELQREPEQVFKTLVTRGSRSGEHFVFVIPVDRELDLKKAARAVGEKAVAMIPMRELLPLTGYVHGGCSPIGMKKFFTTTLDASARNWPTILFSAGKIGRQVELAPADLERVIRLQYADVTTSPQ